MWPKFHGSMINMTSSRHHQDKHDCALMNIKSGSRSIAFSGVGKVRSVSVKDDNGYFKQVDKLSGQQKSQTELKSYEIHFQL